MRQSKRLNQFATTVRLRHSSRLTSPANNRLLSNKPRNSRQHSNRRRRLAANRRHSSKPTRLANSRLLSNKPRNSRQHSNRRSRRGAKRRHKNRKPIRLANSRLLNSRQPSNRRHNSKPRRLARNGPLSSRRQPTHGLIARRVCNLFQNRRCNRPNG